MTFYQELQLNQAGSKKLIREAQGYKEKLRHIAIYLFKIFITLVFCMAFVIAYTHFFGNANSIVGVVILLFVLVFRNVDLSLNTSHALGSLIAIFMILAFGPRLSNASNAFIALVINILCIFSLMFLGCYDVKMFNHSTLVLGYLLLYGYDVSGAAYYKRLEGLAIGCLITSLIYYRNHRKKTHTLKVTHFFEALDLQCSRTKWQLSLTIATSSMLFIARLIQLPRPMWAGIAIMSIITPFPAGHKEKVKSRILGNIFGALLVFLIYKYCPDFMYNNIGILSGIGVGLSATYGFQSMFNAFGAIATAATILGFPAALFFRVFNNILGALYGLTFNKYFHKFIGKIA